MEKICLLNSEVNRCQYFDGVKHCNAPHMMCGMMVKLSVDESKPKNTYVRKERWYEKYYKDR